MFARGLTAFIIHGLRSVESDLYKMSLTELGYSGICPRADNHGSFANPSKCYKLGTLVLCRVTFQ